MIKRKCFFLIIALNAFCINAQTLLIKKKDTSYILNQNVLKSQGKTCLVINYFAKDFIEVRNQVARPLIVCKVFDYVVTKISEKPNHIIELSDYVTNKIIPKLSADMFLRLENLEMVNSERNIQVFDSLIFSDGKSFELIVGGVITLEFFNLVNYKSFHPLQTNQSVFNTEADPVKINQWTKDSIPSPDINTLTGGKMFLLKRRGNNYTFFCSPFLCSDCELSFYNEYVYRKDYGVIAFKSKYLFKRKPVEIPLKGKIGESDDYYYFR